MSRRCRAISIDSCRWPTFVLVGDLEISRVLHRYLSLLFWEKSLLPAGIKAGRFAEETNLGDPNAASLSPMTSADERGRDRTFRHFYAGIPLRARAIGCFLAVLLAAVRVPRVERSRGSSVIRK